MKRINRVLRVLMVVIVILGGTLFSMADPLPGSVCINFRVGIYDPTTGHGGIPRSPINPPSASIDGYTLYMEGDHPAYELYLVDTTGEEPDVVYQITVPANVNVVYLPATFTGTFELQLYDGGEYYFYSKIEL